LREALQLEVRTRKSWLIKPEVAALVNGPQRLSPPPAASLGDERIPVGPVVTATGEQADPLVRLPRDQAVPIVLDLVHALRGPVGGRDARVGDAGLDKARRASMGGRRAEQHVGQYGPGERCLPVRARPAEKKPRRRLTQRGSQDCVGRRLCGSPQRYPGMPMAGVNRSNASGQRRSVQADRASAPTIPAGRAIIWTWKL
jgi:hypothetical protein